MSIVAWDGQFLAADRLAVSRGCARRVPKICTSVDMSTGKQVVAAYCGTQSRGLVLRQWFEMGAERKEWPPLLDQEDWTSLIVIFPEHTCYVFEESPTKLLIAEPFWAWGSGRDYALGAMARGANAIEAVRIASRFDVYCGGGVDAYWREDDVWKFVNTKD